MSEESKSCPKCGSSNIQFKRERAGSFSKGSVAGVKLTKHISTGGGTRNTTYQYRNIGFCKDCGHAWNANSNGKASRPAWFWILAVIFFPISLSVLFWKSDLIKLNKKVKGAILAVVWAILLLFSGNSDSTETTEPETVIEQEAETQEETKATTVKDTDMKKDKDAALATKEETVPVEKEEETKTETATTTETTPAAEPVTEPAPAPVEAVPVEAAPVVTETPNTQSELTVFVAPEGGERYHYKRSCRALKNANSIVELSISDAQAQGYTLCGYED